MLYNSYYKLSKLSDLPRARPRPRLPPLPRFRMTSLHTKVGTRVQPLYILPQHSDIIVQFIDLRFALGKCLGIATAISTDIGAGAGIGIGIGSSIRNGIDIDVDIAIIRLFCY